MSWWEPSKFKEKLPNLQKRQVSVRLIRTFFDQQQFFEVETPILQKCPIIDTHIHSFKTELKGLDLQSKKEFYLQVSPEFDMKKLLIAGCSPIYQICHVFRNGEDSRLHNAEFTMIEWYRLAVDYKAIMQDCQDLIRFMLSELNQKQLNFKDKKSNPFDDWQIISVCEAFKHYADIVLLLI